MEEALEMALFPRKRKKRAKTKPVETDSREKDVSALPDSMTTATETAEGSGSPETLESWSKSKAPPAPRPSDAPEPHEIRMEYVTRQGELIVVLTHEASKKYGRRKLIYKKP